jgi:hypothetical protein
MSMHIRRRVIALAVGSLMFALTSAALGPMAAVAAETGTGRLEFVHAAQGAPNLSISLFEPGGAVIGRWVATPGSTTTPVPDDPLAPGTYSMRIDPPGGGSTGGLAAIARFDVPISAGVTTVATARGDSLDSLEFALSTQRIGAADEDEQVPLPTRIDAGAGGTAGDDSPAPLMPSALLAVIASLAGFLAWRRRTHRADGRARGVTRAQ